MKKAALFVLGCAVATAASSQTHWLNRLEPVSDVRVEIIPLFCGGRLVPETSFGPREKMAIAPEIRTALQEARTGSGFNPACGVNAPAIPLSDTIPIRSSKTIPELLAGSTGCGLVVREQPKKPGPVRLVSRASVMADSPLIVIDGNLSDESRMKGLDPNSIESITVLKGVSATALYGSIAAKGVIVVTTRRPAKGAWMVVDAETLRPLEGATFEELGYQKTAPIAVTDSGGVTKAPAVSGQYLLEVNCAGYRSQLVGPAEMKTNSGRVLLERRYDGMEEVVIRSSGTPRRGCPRGYSIERTLSCTGIGVKISSQVEQAAPHSAPTPALLYPNPVPSGASASWKMPVPVGSITVFTASGQLVRSFPGGGRIDGTLPIGSLAAGIYLVRFTDTAGRELGTGRLQLQ